jgi:hypothetical protein
MQRSAAAIAAAQLPLPEVARPAPLPAAELARRQALAERALAGGALAEKGLAERGLAERAAQCQEPRAPLAPASVLERPSEVGTGVEIRALRGSEPPGFAGQALHDALPCE